MSQLSEEQSNDLPSTESRPQPESQSVIPTQSEVPQPPSGQPSNTPQPAPLGQRRRRVIVTAVAALLYCLAVYWILWKIGFAWYIAVVLPVLALILIGLILLGYTPKWSKYTGFGEYKSTYSKNQDVQRAKTLWDWLQLLGVIAIPIAVTIASLVFTDQHNHDLQINTDQQQQMTLEKYLETMSDLLLNHRLLGAKPGDGVLALAQAHTLTALQELNPGRKSILLQFLHEARLIEKGTTIIQLDFVDLNNTNLHLANLKDANLRGVRLNDANLQSADLTGADLSGAFLDNADLSNAYLFCFPTVSGPPADCTILSGASLSGANLSGALLNGADLEGADLTDANLSGAFLTNAKLDGAMLDGANLKGATITNEQLAKAKSLQGATMPNGSIHP